MSSINVEAEKKAILRSIKNLESDENRKDVEGILELIVDDFILVHRETRREGINDVRELLEKHIDGYKQKQHVPLRVEVSLDMAWLFGYEVDESGRKEYYLMTFRKVDGVWKQAAVCVT